VVRNRVCHAGQSSAEEQESSGKAKKSKSRRARRGNFRPRYATCDM